MNFQAVLNDFKMLPPDKQQQVANYIAFLKTRLPGKRKNVKSPETDVKKKNNLVDFFKESPLYNSGIDLERRKR